MSFFRFCTQRQGLYQLGKWAFHAGGLADLLTFVGNFEVLLFFFAAGCVYLLKILFLTWRAILRCLCQPTQKWPGRPRLLALLRSLHRGGCCNRYLGDLGNSSDFVSCRLLGVIFECTYVAGQPSRRDAYVACHGRDP